MTKTTANPEYNSLKYVMALFKEILETEKAMLAQQDNNSYYAIQEALNKQLVAFLRLNFTYLNTMQILKLCSLVSAHRPVQPFSFLITCSMLCPDSSIKDYELAPL